MKRKCMIWIKSLGYQSCLILSWVWIFPSNSDDYLIFLNLLTNAISVFTNYLLFMAYEKSGLFKAL